LLLRSNREVRGHVEASQVFQGSRLPDLVLVQTFAAQFFLGLLDEFVLQCFLGLGFCDLLGAFVNRSPGRCFFGWLREDALVRGEFVTFVDFADYGHHVAGLCIRGLDPIRLGIQLANFLLDLLLLR